MPYDSLGDFLSALHDAGDLVRITAAVDSGEELGAIVDRMVRSSPRGAPGLLFTSVRNSHVPVVANVLGHPQRLARALGAESLAAAQARLTASLKPERPGSWWDALRLAPQLGDRSSWTPRSVKQGLCQQVVKLGRDVNLYELPTPRHWPQESHPTLTAGLLITAAADQPTRIARHPVHVVDRQRLLPYWLPQHPVSALVQQSRAEQRQMPVALVFGGDPSLLIAAEAADWLGLPDGYLWPGLLRGRAFDLVKCRTHGLEVPADAEMVIEGFVDPDAAWEPMGGVALSTGHVAEAIDVPPIHVTAITHRASPILPTIMPGRPPHEDAWLRHAVDRLFLPAVQALAPEIVDCVRPWSGFTRHTVFVSIRKQQPYQARKVMHALWGSPAFQSCKMIVVVDAAVDVQREVDVWSAVAAHVDPVRDMIILTGAADADDHATAIRGAGGKWGVDATCKLPAEGAGRPWPPALAWTTESQRALAQRWVELGLPEAHGLHPVGPAESMGRRGESL
jgi:4-hydroxy-3-polyprenylbenzoate decarboxylase